MTVSELTARSTTVWPEETRCFATSSAMRLFRRRRKMRCSAPSLSSYFVSSFTFPSHNAHLVFFFGGLLLGGEGKGQLTESQNETLFGRLTPCQNDVGQCRTKETPPQSCFHRTAAIAPPLTASGWSTPPGSASPSASSFPGAVTKPQTSSPHLRLTTARLPFSRSTNFSSSDLAR